MKSLMKCSSPIIGRYLALAFNKSIIKVLKGSINYERGKDISRKFSSLMSILTLILVVKRWLNDSLLMLSVTFVLSSRLVSIQSCSGYCVVNFGESLSLVRLLSGLTAVSDQ